MTKRHPLVVKLKSGEYDGKDIMDAWLLIERLTAENKSKSVALDHALLALNDWMNLYASDICSPDRVKQAQSRMKNRGGLAYIGEAISVVSDAIYKPLQDADSTLQRSKDD